VVVVVGTENGRGTGMGNGGGGDWVVENERNGN
jgi:hypothetical protein